MKTYFDHEKLDVYRESIAFCGWVGEILEHDLCTRRPRKINSTALRPAFRSTLRKVTESFRRAIGRGFLKLRVDRRWNVRRVLMSWSFGS